MEMMICCCGGWGRGCCGEGLDTLHCTDGFALHAPKGDAFDIVVRW